MAQDLRCVRVPRIVALLREQPLPAEALLPRLNQTLVADRLPEVGLRTLLRDLAWMHEQLGAAAIEKVPRSALAQPPPADLAHHRWFYRIAGAENLIPVDPDLCFVTELEVLALHTARALLTAPDTGATRDEGPLAAALGRVLHRGGLDRPGARIPDVIGVNLAAPQPWDPGHALAILRAIRLGDAVAMRYASLDKPMHDVLAQPVRLVLTDGEPYLWAWDAAAAKLKTYKLARVAGVELRPRLAKVPAGLDREVRSLLSGAFRGVASMQQRGRVVVRLAPAAVPHLRNRRLGGHQTWEDLPGGGARVAFNTSGIEAVRHWLLQSGAQLVVEGPPDLVAWFRDETRRMAAAYPNP